MKYQTRTRLEHGTSFFISVIANSVLLVAMLHFITMEPVRRALDWLVSVQLDDGSWHRRGETGGRNGSTGTTGLALLTFLSNGQTPSSAEYGETVVKAIRYLADSQQENGMIWRRGSGSEVYAHAMAAYALAEAYTMTNNRLLREPVQKSSKVIIEGMMADGGFPGAGGGRYQYGNTGSNDASVGGWNIQALKAIQIASRTHQLEIPGLDQALQKAMDGMLLNASETDRGNMTIGYSGPGKAETVTAAGGLAMHLTGRANARDTRRIIAHLRQFEPEWGNAVITSGGGEINHWYYTIQAFFHSDPRGRDFRRYNKAVATALVQNQHQSGRWDCFTGRQGPLFDTTLAALSLMVYYRYLPTTQAEQIQARPRQAEPLPEDDDIITITL